MSLEIAIAVVVGGYLGFIGTVLWLAYLVRQARRLAVAPVGEVTPRDRLLERLAQADAVLAFVAGPEQVLGFKSCVRGCQ